MYQKRVLCTLMDENQSVASDEETDDQPDDTPMRRKRKANNIPLRSPFSTKNEP